MKNLIILGFNKYPLQKEVRGINRVRGMVMRCVWTEVRWAGVFIDTWQIQPHIYYLLYEGPQLISTSESLLDLRNNNYLILSFMPIG